jgi:hypothetical protein
MDNAGNYHLYIYFRPNGVPCYVGIGRNKRWLDHLKKGSGNRHLKAIIALAGGTTPHVKIRDGMTKAQAIEAEIALIAAIGRKDLGTGPLVNLTDGGDGPSGFIVGEDVRRIIGQKSKEKWNDPATRARIIEAQNKGRATPEYRKKRSEISKANASNSDVRARSAETKRKTLLNPEIRKKISIATRNAMARPEIKCRMSEAQKKRFESPEARAKLGNNTRGRKLSLEHKQKIAAKHRGQKRSKEARAKMSAWQIGRKMSPETKKKLSVAKLGKPLSLEHRAKLSEAQKLRQARIRGHI